MYFRFPKDYLVNVCEDENRNIMGDDYLNNIYRKNCDVKCNCFSEEQLEDCELKEENSIWEKIDEEYAAEMMCKK